MPIILFNLVVGYLAIGFFITASSVWIAWHLKDHPIKIIFKMQPISTLIGFVLTSITWPVIFKGSKK